MTEITKSSSKMPVPVQRFVLHWGDMGETWGVNRSVSQIHALLYISARAMTAEEIAEALGIARSNVSNSLRELLSWSLIRRVPVLGDRRDHYEAEADILEMVRRIALGRKVRELDPALAVLRACVAEAGTDKSTSAEARARFKQMLDVVEGVDRSFDQLIHLPGPMLARLIRMGGTIARLVSARGRRG